MLRALGPTTHRSPVLTGVGPSRRRSSTSAGSRGAAGLYLSFVAWGWFLYSFGPSVDLLGKELGVSNAVAGLHGTALAVGGLVAGWSVPLVVGRLGHPKTLQAAALVLVVGVAGLLLAPGIGWTLGATLVTSVGGSALIAVSTVALVRHDPVRAPQTLAGANGAGSGIGVLAPVVVGSFVALGWGWRAAVLVAVLLALVVAFLVAPRVETSHGTEAGSVSGAGAGGWFLLAVLAGIAMEFMTTFWAVALVGQRTGAPTSVAAGATAGFLVGMTVSRLAASRLLRSVSPHALLAAGFMTGIVGWAVMWSSRDVVLSLLGLAVLGVGVGVTYPLSVAAVLHHAGPGSHDRAQGQTNLVAGAAVGIAPFALGGLADLVGMHMAFVLVPVTAVLGVGAVLLGQRVAGSPHGSSRPAGAAQL